MIQRSKGQKGKQWMIPNKIILPWGKVRVKGVTQFYNHWQVENAYTSD
jgi:hypothetical protein